jgi:uncharacterized OB-fold protein
MEGHVLTWTRLERPPSGFVPGRVLALVEAGEQRLYALVEGPEPRIGARVGLEPRGDTWVATVR